MVTTIPMCGPYDFGLYPKLFVHQEDTYLPFRYSPSRWSRLIELDNGYLVPTSVTCEYDPEPRLRLMFMTDLSRPMIRTLKSKVAASFCATLDLEPLYCLASLNARLKRLMRELNGLRPHLSIDPFESLIKVIVRQVVRATTAQRLIDNLVRKFGNSVRVGEDTYFSFPTPEALATAHKRDLLDCRIGYKWNVIREVSRDVVEGDLDFEQLRQLADEEIVSFLSDYKWIGPWTSRVFLYDGLHRLNAYPHFDISIRRATAGLQLSGTLREFESKSSSTLQPLWGAMVSYLFGSLWTSKLSKY